MTQKDALTILKMGYNCYITGAAGSGKTHLLNEYIKYLRELGASAGVTASTGIAATHMGGTTIHSWSGLGIKDELTEYDLESLEEKKHIQDRFRETDILIIDEVSMLHHFRLDLVERIARHLRKNSLPFGGMQVILCGDFFQLPPVSRMGERESHFVYRSETWKKLNLKICYLEEQHRQEDKDLLRILNAMRKDSVNTELLDLLRSRYDSQISVSIEPTKLHTHNLNVDSMNDAELNKLSGQLYAFHMEEKGRKPLVEALKKSCLAPETLRLKIGARVMFVKNNPEAGYANGTLGKVVSVSYDGPTVMLANGKLIKPEKVSWVVEEEGKVKATITQFPLRLAWAITVHKSQGMSLDAAEVDLSQSFEPGMGYVALSRVRTLAGLRLLGLNKNALSVRGDVLVFDEELQEMSESAERWLNSLDDAEIKTAQEEFAKRIEGDISSPKKKGRRVSPLAETKEMLQAGASIEDMLHQKGVKIGTLLDHIEKIVAADPDLDINYLKTEIPIAKFKKAYQTFRDMYGENRDFLLAPIKNKIGDGITYEELRIVRLFVKRSLG